MSGISVDGFRHFVRKIRAFWTTLGSRTRRGFTCRDTLIIKIRVFCASENPNAIHEEPPYSEKIGVWCGMSRRRILGPIFDTTITKAPYMEIFNTFVNQLDDEEFSIGYLQQD